MKRLVALAALSLSACAAPYAGPMTLGPEYGFAPQQPCSSYSPCYLTDPTTGFVTTHYDNSSYTYAAGQAAFYQHFNDQIDADNREIDNEEMQILTAPDEP